MSFRAKFEHRDQLLAAAIDEFCERGYDAASINRILTTSGVSKGQLYHHFDGKRGLYLSLIEWMIDQKLAWFAHHPMAPTGDFFATLGAYMRANVAFAGTHSDVERFATSLLAERGRPIFDEVQDRFEFDPAGPLGALVDHHIAAGGFRDDLSADFVRRLVLLVVNHAPDLLDLHKPADLEPRLDELLTVLRHGLHRQA